jgi:hypothetical protein
VRIIGTGTNETTTTATTTTTTITNITTATTVTTTTITATTVTTTTATTVTTTTNNNKCCYKLLIVRLTLLKTGNFLNDNYLRIYFPAHRKLPALRMFLVGFMNSGEFTD